MPWGFIISHILERSIPGPDAASRKPNENAEHDECKMKRHKTGPWFNWCSLLDQVSQKCLEICHPLATLLAIQKQPNISWWSPYVWKQDHNTTFTEKFAIICMLHTNVYRRWQVVHKNLYFGQGSQLTFQKQEWSVGPKMSMPLHNLLC